MLELPEAITLSSQLTDTLSGKKIRDATANQSPHGFAWLSGDTDFYRDRLSGQTVRDARPYGGMADLRIEGGWHLVFCDGTNVRYFAPGEKLPPKHQLQVEFEDGSSLTCSVQMYGAMWLFDDDHREGYYTSSSTKVTPLSEGFTTTYYDGLIASVKPNTSVKALLATEQRLPGLGNGVLQDILFNAGVHPRRRVDTLTAEEKTCIYHSIVATLTEMTAAGGRDTDRDLYGARGGYKTKLSAKTKGQPCPSCGGEILREAYLGGNVYFCPACQPYAK